jgi:hypothetical protein
MEEVNEIYVEAYWQFAMEINDSTLTGPTEVQLRMEVGPEDFDRRKANGELFYTVYGRTDEGLSYALEDFTNEAEASKRATELHAEYSKNAKLEAPVEIPASIAKAVADGELKEEQAIDASKYYIAFKLRAETGYGYGDMADENIDLVIRRFNSLSAEELESPSSIMRAASRDMTEIAEENGFFSSGLRG